jgi:phosphate transport system substrate-binding protein
MTTLLHVTSFILLLAASVTRLAASDTALTLTGSSTVAPLVSEIARVYEARHPDVRIDVQTGGSTRGVADVRAGRSTIGMVSRKLKADESDLTAYTIALDGVACIAHRDNQVARLTRAQVIDIYTGKVTNWHEVGGADLPIVVVNKSEAHSTLELFLHHFEIKTAAIKAAVVIADNAQGIKTVAVTPGAIAYLSIGAAQTDINAGVAIKLLTLDGHVPSFETVRDGTWPLTRPLNLVVTSAPTGSVAGLIELARSTAVEALITDLAFVSPQR